MSAVGTVLSFRWFNTTIPTWFSVAAWRHQPPPPHYHLPSHLPPKLRCARAQPVWRNLPLKTAWRRNSRFQRPICRTATTQPLWRVLRTFYYPLRATATWWRQRRFGAAWHHRALFARCSVLAGFSNAMALPFWFYYYPTAPYKVRFGGLRAFKPPASGAAQTYNNHTISCLRICAPCAPVFC